jgi:hypothetical protein
MYTLKNYIDHKGAATVSREMGVSETTISFWYHFKTSPRPHQASKLITLTNNILTWEGIYQPFVDHNNESQVEMDFGEKGSK